MTKQMDIATLPISHLQIRPEDRASFQASDGNTALLAEVKENGILHPITVQPIFGSPGKYIVVCGIPAFAAAKNAGCTEVPCIIYDFPFKAEVFYNRHLFGERLLFSQYAEMCLWRMETIKEKRNRGEIDAEVGKRTDTIVEEELGPGFSRSSIQRYIRLTYLRPELKTAVDKRIIAKSVGEYLSYLDYSTQKAVYDYYKKQQELDVSKKSFGDFRPNNRTSKRRRMPIITLSMAREIKQMYETTVLNKEILWSILMEERTKSEWNW